jgi:transcription elongation factor GreA
MKTIHVTKEGYEKLQKEYQELLTQRPDAVEHLKRSRELGDLKENGYYKASRAKLSFMDSRLFYLKNVLSKSKIVEVMSSEFVTIGCKVKVKGGKGEKDFTIVGELEADPMAGKLSEVSPFGRALLGKKVGENVNVSAPLGMMSYTIVDIYL